MTQTQTRYKLVSPNEHTRCVCFIVEGDDVWVHYYGTSGHTQAESSLTVTNPATGEDFVVRPGTPISRELGKAVWDRFVEVGFVRG